MLALTPPQDITPEALAAISPTLRAIRGMDCALARIDHYASRLASAWAPSMPADCVHAYPFGADLDELIARGPGYVSARADVLAHVLREAGVPAYVEGDGRLVFVTIDGRHWATALAGWHVQSAEALETSEILSRRTVALETDQLEQPAAPMAVALLQSIADYNRSSLRAHTREMV